ncbi:MAG: EscF/YscF/HrpA family type III secretion system needle major subunit [Noviherbaspirillum sp.]
MATDNFTLKHLHEQINPKVVQAAEHLDDEFAKVDESGNMSAADMLALQVEMSKYTLMVSIGSSMTKEIIDTMKSVVQKIT